MPCIVFLVLDSERGAWGLGCIWLCLGYLSIRSHFFLGPVLSDGNHRPGRSLPFSCFCSGCNKTKPRFVIFHPQQLGSYSIRRDTGDGSRPSSAGPHPPWPSRLGVQGGSACTPQTARAACLPGAVESRRGCHCQTPASSWHVGIARPSGPAEETGMKALE